MMEIKKENLISDLGLESTIVDIKIVSDKLEEIQILINEINSIFNNLGLKEIDLDLIHK